jgi:hypothetical protein
MGRRYQPALLLPVRESKRLRVSLSTRQFLPIHSGSERYRGRARPPQKGTKGIEEGYRFPNIYRG